MFLALVATLPIVIVGLLMIALTWPSSRAMPIGWLAAAVIALFGWGMPPRWLLAASLGGLISAVDILVIVFGALLILQLMKRSGGMRPAG